MDCLGKPAWCLILESLYFKKDPHITEYGHKAVAESIYEFLKND